MWYLIILILTLLILFLPIYLKVYLYYSVKDKRLYFAIFFFNFIKIVTGYVNKRKEGGVYVHLKNKAIIFDNDFYSKHKQDKISKDTFKVSNVKLYVDMGIDNANAVVTLFSLINFANLLNKNIYFNKRRNFKSYLNVYDEQVNIISVYLSFYIRFNLFCILKDIFANFIFKGVIHEKIKNA